jgi:hypothetical protein
MATNRDWQLGNIELPTGSDQALGVWTTGDASPNFKVLANGAVTAASVTAPVTFLSLGAATTPTIAAGVLTVTSSHVNPLPESGTADTVDSIVKSGQAAGDLLLVHVPATNTITFDNSATMLLGAATRAVAPGGSLLLVAVSATVWHEVSFLAATS